MSAESAVQLQFGVGAREAVLNRSTAEIEAHQVFTWPGLGLEVGDEHLVLRLTVDMSGTRLFSGDAPRGIW